MDHLPKNWQGLTVAVAVANPPPAKDGTYMKQADFDRFIHKVNSTRSLENAVPVHLNHVTKDASGVDAIPAGHVIAADIHPSKKELVVGLLIHDTPTGKLAQQMLKEGKFAMTDVSLGVESVELPRFWNKEFGHMGYVPVEKDVKEVSLCQIGDLPNTKIVYVTTLGEYLKGNVKGKDAASTGTSMTPHADINNSHSNPTGKTEQNFAGTKTVETVASAPASFLNPFAEPAKMRNFGEVRIDERFSASKSTPIMDVDWTGLMRHDLTPYKDRIFEFHDRLIGNKPGFGARVIGTAASAQLDPQTSIPNQPQQSVSAPAPTDAAVADGDDVVAKYVADIKSQFEQFKLQEQRAEQLGQQQQAPGTAQAAPGNAAAPAAAEAAPLSEADIVLPPYIKRHAAPQMTFEDFVRNQLNMDPATLTPSARATLEETFKQSQIARELPYELEMKRLEKERLEFQDLLRKNLPAILENMRKKDPNISLDSIKALFASVPLIQDPVALDAFKKIISTHAQAALETKTLQQKYETLSATQRERDHSDVEKAIGTAKRFQDMTQGLIEKLEQANETNKRLRSSYEQLKVRTPYGLASDDRVVSVNTTASASSATYNAARNAAGIEVPPPRTDVKLLGSIAYMEAANLYPEASAAFPGYLEQTRDLFSELQSYRLGRSPVASDFKGQADRLRYLMKYHPVDTTPVLASGPSPYASVRKY